MRDKEENFHEEGSDRGALSADTESRTHPVNQEPREDDSRGSCVSGELWQRITAARPPPTGRRELTLRAPGCQQNHRVGDLAQDTLGPSARGPCEFTTAFRTGASGTFPRRLQVPRLERPAAATVAGEPREGRKARCRLAGLRVTGLSFVDSRLQLVDEIRARLPQAACPQSAQRCCRSGSAGQTGRRCSQQRGHLAAPVFLLSHSIYSPVQN
jgi:hypothetical protein